MQFICAADTHLTNKAPKSRKGDYFGQSLEKFEFILKESEKTDSKILVIAGDFFDTAKSKYKVTNKILETLKKYKKVKVLVVSGQHDLNFHVGSLDDTPLGNLQAANVVHILKNNEIYEFNGISFVGSSWNEEPKEEADILVMHRMITKKGELWPGQTNYSTAHSILRKYSWARVIISGDNHAPHVLRTKKGTIQINCGSMMRSTKDQINFEPRVYLVDCDNWKAKAIKIPCLPSEKVFDMEHITIEEMKDESKRIAKEKISDFINTLPKNEQERPNFQKILSNVVDHVQPNEDVRSIINDTMERIS
jgi:DNA repair exonuclease SbcCD nuclease subunit